MMSRKSYSSLLSKPRRIRLPRERERENTVSRFNYSRKAIENESLIRDRSFRVAEISFSPLPSFLRSFFFFFSFRRMYIKVLERTDKTKGPVKTLGIRFFLKYSSRYFLRETRKMDVFSLPFSLCLLKKSLGQNAEPFL